MDEHQSNGQEIIVQPTENIVEIDGGNMFTTSLTVAQAFEKEHFNVLRDIEKLECSETFRALNFEATEYQDAQGKMRPAYRMTRDGFSFLAMGFTGKKAAAWKEKFLEAFNAMEAELTRRDITVWMPPKESAPMRKQRIIKILRGLIAYWAFVDKMPYAVAELALCTHLELARLDDITEEGDGPQKINAAFAYLEEVSNRPTGDTEDRRAAQNEIIMLRHMLAACGQWRYTRDQDFEQYFEELTGVNSLNLGKLSSHDAEKMLSTAGCLLHQTHQYTLDWNEFAGEMAE